MCIVILELSSQQTSSENVAQASSKGRPLSNVSIGLGEYQRTLEEVLTWLLGAEDRLAVMPPIANTTEEVKDQFHDLEVGSCLSRMFYTSVCLNLHVFPYRRQFWGQVIPFLSGTHVGANFKAGRYWRCPRRGIKTLKRRSDGRRGRGRSPSADEAPQHKMGGTKSQGDGSTVKVCMILVTLPPYCGCHKEMQSFCVSIY